MSFTGPRINLNSSILDTTSLGFALEHVDSNGSSHGFINQDVTTNASPSFDSLSLNGGRLTLLGTPTASTDATTKNYVDNTITGLQTKESVRATTTVAGTLTTDFANTDIIDGVTLDTGDRILIKDQAAGVENGIYVVAETGSPSRSADMPDGSNARSVYVLVEEGTAFADVGFVCTNDAGSDLVGTDALVFGRFSEIVNAGAGLDKVATTLSVNVDGTTIEIISNTLQANIATLAGDGLIEVGQGMAVNVDGVTIDIANDSITANTATLAGDGLLVSGSGLAVNVDATTIEIVSDGLQFAAGAAGPGLIRDTANGNALAVNVDGVTINIVDGALTGAQLITAGTGLVDTANVFSVNVDGVTINVTDTGAMQANIATLAGNGLLEVGPGMAINTDGVTIELVNDSIQANIATLAGDGLISVGQGMAVNVDSVNIIIENDGIRLAGNLDTSFFSSNAVSAINEVGLGPRAFIVNNETDLRSAISSVASFGSGKILIQPGTITISSNPVINVPNNCAIMGCGPSSILEGTSSLIAIFEISHASNVSIKDLTFVEVDNSVNSIDIVGNCENVSISDCSFTFEGSVGSAHISVSDANSVIKNLRITNNDMNRGNHIAFGSSPLRVEGLVISHNTLHDSTSSTPFGISFANNTFVTGTISDNILSNIAGTSGAIRIQPSSTDPNPDSNLIITGNQLRNCETNWNINNGVEFLVVKDNISDRHIVTSSATDINGYEDKVTLNITSGSVTATLGNLARMSSGHRMYIELSDLSGSDLTVTPDVTHTDFSTPGGAATYSSITFNSAGDYAILEWQGNGWNIWNAVGVTIA